MNKELVLKKVKDYLHNYVNKYPTHHLELVVEPVITLSWGIVFGYDLKDENDFLAGNTPVLYDHTKNKIVHLKTIIDRKDGQKRGISFKLALEKYRKKYGLGLLNKQEYEDIIFSCGSGGYKKFEEDFFEDLINAIKNYKQLIKEDTELDRNTIALIFKTIRDMEYMQEIKEISTQKKKLINTSIIDLKQLFEELLWENVKTWDPMNAEYWYGIKQRE